MLDFWNSAAFAGAAGGFALGLVLLVLDAVELMRSNSPAPRVRQMVFTQLGVAAALTVLGGIAAYFMSGRAGDFLEGISALGFILLILGGTFSSISLHGGRHVARAADPQG